MFRGVLGGIVFLLAFAASVWSTGKVVDCGVGGQTWSIREKDLAAVIEDAFSARVANLRKEKDRIRSNLSTKIKSFFYHLPHTKEFRVHSVSLVWEVPTDVVIPAGEKRQFVYWPRGTKINLLKYVPYFPIYVVFNPNNVEELETVKVLLESDRIRGEVRGLVTYALSSVEGSKVRNALLKGIMNRITVRPLSRTIAERFSLSATVSVICPDQRKGEVKVYEVPSPKQASQVACEAVGASVYVAR